MKVVIDIPRKTYEHIRSCGGHGIFNIQDNDNLIVTKAIFNGTVLPKGHGRLVDADSLLDHIVDYGEGQNRLMLIDPYYVRNADAIIEADKEAENETLA